jgi:hypothetical protein
MLKPSVGAHGLGDVLIVGNPDSCLPTVGEHYLSYMEANQYDVANVIISYFDVIECNINVIMSIHNICMSRSTCMCSVRSTLMRCVQSATRL